MSKSTIREIYNVFFNNRYIERYFNYIRSLHPFTPELYQDLLSYNKRRIKDICNDSGKWHTCDIEIRHHNDALKRIKECKHMFYPTLESIILDKMKENNCDLNLIPFIKRDVVDH